MKLTLDEWRRYIIELGTKNTSIDKAKLISLLTAGISPDLSVHHKDGYIKSNFVMLTIAAAQGDVDCINILLNVGADINNKMPTDGACSNHEQTALHAAVNNGHVNAAKLLVRRGASLVVKTNPAYYYSTDMKGSALQKAILMGSDEMITLVLSFYQELTQEDLDLSLYAATTRANLGWMKFFVEKGANVNTSDGKYSSLIQEAWRAVKFIQSPDNYSVYLEPSYDHIDYLISLGADLVADIDYKGNSLLHTAAEESYENSKCQIMRINYLLKNGLDVHKTNAKGQTPLHLAAKFRENAVELLLTHGARIDVVDNDGKIPADYAINHSIYRRLDDLAKKRKSLNCSATLFSSNHEASTPPVAIIAPIGLEEGPAPLRLSGIEIS